MRHGRGRTSVELEDTPANQEEHCQPVRQKPGCGFPVMQIVALFNLGSSALERFSFSPHTADEGGMFDVELREHLQAGDVLLGDRLYGSYPHFAALAAWGVDVLTRLNGSRGWPKGMPGDDVTVQWRRPAPPAAIPLRGTRYACLSKARWTLPCASPPKWRKPAASNGTACDTNCCARSLATACPGVSIASNPGLSNDDQNRFPE